MKKILLATLLAGYLGATKAQTLQSSADAGHTITSSRAGNPGGYSGNIRLNGDNPADNWALISMPDHVNSSGAQSYWLIGRGASLTDRAMSFHIPSYADYANTGNRPYFKFAKTGDVPLMTLDADGKAYISGNLGIGTSSPHVKLDVLGKERVHNALGTNDYTFVGQHTGQIRVTNGLGPLASRALEFALLDNGTGIIQANEAGVGYNTLALNPVTGNVGIGTTSASNKLVVHGGGQIISEISSADDNAGLYVRAATTSHYPHLRFDQAGTGKMEMGVDPFQGFYLNHSTSSGSAGADLYIASNKNVGIGTTSPSQKFVVQDAGQVISEVVSTNDNAAIYIRAATTSHYPHMRFDQAGAGRMEMGVDPQQGFYLNHTISNGSGGADLYISSVKNVGIGTTNPTAKLSVNGNIRAKEIKVEASPWPDYVFHSSYKLPDLKATEQFIKENKHLPEIPSAAEVEKDGINLGEMNARLLKKIEELTLHLIEQNKKQAQLSSEVTSLREALIKLTNKP